MRILYVAGLTAGIVFTLDERGVRCWIEGFI
jgi:hypothetical protein